MPLLTTVARRTPSDLLLATEALLLLAVFRLSLAVVPVRRILRTMYARPRPACAGRVAPSRDACHRHPGSLGDRGRHAQLSRRVCLLPTDARRIRHAPPSRRAQHHMVYGVARGQKGELLAHTWLTVGDSHRGRGRRLCGVLSHRTMELNRRNLASQATKFFNTASVLPRLNCISTHEPQ